MDVEQVAALLSGAATPDAAHCRQDLEHGARLDAFPGLVVTSELRELYRRRAEHLDGQHIDATGAFETVEALDATPHAELALARVSGGPSGRIFQLFLTPRLDQLVTCLVLPTKT